MSHAHYLAGPTLALVTDQFQCERIIRCGRKLADIAKGNLTVLNVQDSRFQQNPQALEHLFKVSRQHDAEMNVIYAENASKTIIHYIKQHGIKFVVSGMPQQDNSPLHHIWSRFAQVRFFTVDLDGGMLEVLDKMNHCACTVKQPT